jgi:splicing factor 4
VYGKTELSSDQWKQLEDQRKMRVLTDMMHAKQREADRLASAGRVKYEYDSDEEIEGGTWEHRRRMEEMEKTRGWADQLTERAKGSHHIGDFLPPDELEKFMQKWDHIKDGNASELYDSDYKDFKLQSDNVGYQMLKKLGWTEGQGLGAESSGISEPINKNPAGFGNAGLGTERPESLKEGDDEYEAYRKRMMIAYRFRPNPLNNPRRAYY